MMILTLKPSKISNIFWLFLFTCIAARAHAASPTPAEIEKEYNSASMRAVARDAFPVLFNPPMGTVADGNKIIQPNEWVIGIEMNGKARAYPVAVMGFHELINDTVGSHPITVCW